MLPSSLAPVVDIGNSISAVAFFEGRLYAADYSKKCLWFFENDQNGAPDMEKPIIIAEGAGAELVDLVRCLWYTFSFLSFSVALSASTLSRHDPMTPRGQAVFISVHAFRFVIADWIMTKTPALRRLSSNKLYSLLTSSCF